MISNNKNIRVDGSVYAFLAHMKMMTDSPSFNSLLKKCGGVIFEFCREEQSRNAWLQIMKEENNLAQHGATE